MGLQLHKITSIKLTDNSTVVEDFRSDVEVSVGDLLNIMGVDYQIESIEADDKLILVKPYVAIGDLVEEEMKIKILPGYIKSQVKLTGVLSLITIEDMELQTTKDMGIKTPGWWYINKYLSGENTRYRNELLVAVNINDSISVEPLPLPEPVPPVVVESTKPTSNTKVSNKK